MVRRVATILAALALSGAAPAAALAQGAGDDQYSDPFGSGQSGDGSNGGGSNGGGQEPEPTPDTSSPSEEPAPTSTPAPTATVAQSSPQAPEQLPRTGDDAAILALAGTVLLTGGVVLRRRVG